MEARVEEVAPRAIAATVGLKIGRNLGSGVIVREDGIVLTAGHVVEEPGRPVEITLSDGRVVSGRTLGVNRWIDSGMLKIDGDGPWPTLEIGTGTGLERGDWVLALGHPGGVEQGRPPVLRLGRVDSSSARVIRTDCTIVSGDSGGPLVDLDGRVIGIHTSLRAVLVANDHLPIDTYQRTWDELLAGKRWGGPPSGRATLGVDSSSQRGPCRIQTIQEGLAADLAGLRSGDLITSLEGVLLSGGFPELEQRVSELHAGTPVHLLVARDDEQLEFEVKLSRLELGEPVRIVPTPRGSLFREKNDAALLRSFRPSVREVHHSVASIVCEGSRVALGAVLDAEGEVLTKASELSGEISCWIDGHSYRATLIATDEESDLALLRIEASGLKPLHFDERELELGQWVVTPDSTLQPASVGVLGVLPRDIPVRSGFLGISMGRRAIDGVPIDGVVEGSSADRVGLRGGDVLTKLDGIEVHTREKLVRMLRSIRPSSEVELEYTREGQVFRVLATLGSHPDEDDSPVELQNRQAGPLSKVRSGFSQAFHHDSVLAPNQCGGPLLDLEGRVIGINLARAGRTSSYGLASAQVLEIVAKLRASAADHSAIPDSVMR